MFYLESSGNFAMVTQNSTGCTRCPGIAVNQRRDDGIYRNDIPELYNDVQKFCYYGIGSCSLWKQCLTGARLHFGERQFIMIIIKVYVLRIKINLQVS